MATAFDTSPQRGLLRMSSFMIGDRRQMERVSGRKGSGARPVAGYSAVSYQRTPIRRGAVASHQGVLAMKCEVIINGRFKPTPIK